MPNPTATTVSPPLPPYAPETRPWYLDQFFKFWLGRGYIYNLQTTNIATTLGATAAANATSIQVASTTGMQVGMPLIIGTSGSYNFQVVGITTVTDSTHCDVQPRIQTGGWASGTAVTSGYQNEAHGSDHGFQALYNWLATAKRRAHTGGINLLGSTVANFETTYTDANGVALCPTGWETLNSGTGTTFTTGPPGWAFNSGSPNAHNAFGTAPIMTATIGAGIRTLAAIPVQPGMQLQLIAHAKVLNTNPQPTIRVIDKTTGTTIADLPYPLGDFRGVYGGTYKTLGNPSTITFTVPTGTTSLEIRLIQMTAFAATVNLDDMRLMVARQDTTQDRYVIEPPPEGRSIVFLADSWGTAPYNVGAWGDYFQLALAHRFGASVPFAYRNAAVSGNTLANQLARWSTDVVPYNPDTVIALFGTNDVAQGYSQATMESETDDLIDRCRAAGYKLVIVGVAPYEGTQTPSPTPYLATAQTMNEYIRARIDRIGV